RAQPLALLPDITKQLDGRQLQVMEGEQVCQRTVHRRQVARNTIDLRPRRALPLQRYRNTQAQQSALAKQLLLGLGRSAVAITLYYRSGQACGKLENRQTPAAITQVHDSRIDHRRDLS